MKACEVCGSTTKCEKCKWKPTSADQIIKKIEVDFKKLNLKPVKKRNVPKKDT